MSFRGLALLAALTASLICTASGTAQARPDRLVERLSVNTSDEFRQVARQPLAVGIAQMGRLCAAPAFEEIWAFAPAEQTWWELGCCEKTTQGGNYVGLERYVFRLMARFERLAIFHIHPKSAFVAENYHASRVLLKTVEEALPSRQDMQAMALISRAYAKVKPKALMTWHIRSRHGVTDYGLAGQTLAAEKQPDFSLFAFGALDEEELDPGEIPEDPTLPGPEVNRLIEKAVKNLNRPGWFVRFHPLPWPPGP